MPLPLTVTRPQPLAVAPAVAGAAALAIGGGMLWLLGRLQRRNFQESLFMNDYQTDALYRRPHYRGMSSDQLQQGLRLLDAIGQDGYLSQPGSVMIERRGIQQELVRRSGGGGFLFIAPDVGLAEEVGDLAVGAAALAVGSAVALFRAGNWLGRWLRDRLFPWEVYNRARQPTQDDWVAAMSQPVMFAQPSRAQFSFYFNLLHCIDEAKVGGVPCWIGLSDGPKAGPFTLDGVDGIRLRSNNRQGKSALIPGGQPAPADTLEPIRGEHLKNGVWTEFWQSKGLNPATLSWSSYRRWDQKGWFGDVTANGAAVAPPGWVARPVIPVPSTAFRTADRVVAPVTAPTPAYLPAEVPGTEPVTQPSAIPDGGGGAGSPAPAGVRVGGAQSVPQLPRPVLIPGGGITTQPDSTLPQPSPAPVPVTPSDVVFPVPGAPPITDAGVRPTPEAIAQEVGRIEQKLEWMLNPTNPRNWPLGDLVFRALQQFADQVPETVYRLQSACERNAAGEPIDRAVEVVIPQQGSVAATLARLDALVELIQGTKDFRQPVCQTSRPTITGELVTVNFRSVSTSPDSNRPLRKYLRYRDNSGRPELFHVKHWLDFDWLAGPAIVTSKGAEWGIVSVWAADPEEGRRVIRHAADAAGVDLDTDGHAFVDSTPAHDRYGKPGLMRVEETIEGRACISKRAGPSGSPSWTRDP